VRKTVFEIFSIKNVVTLKPRYGSPKVIETATIQQTGYSFVFVFYRYFVPKTH